MLKERGKNTEKENKGQLKAEIKEMRTQLIGQQQQMREAKLPVIVLVEGWAAAGKGTLINELISEIDPRFYNVVSPVITPEAQCRYPYLYPYAASFPKTGRSCLWIPAGWRTRC